MDKYLKDKITNLIELSLPKDSFLTGIKNDIKTENKTIDFSKTLANTLKLSTVLLDFQKQYIEGSNNYTNITLKLTNFIYETINLCIELNKQQQKNY